MCTLAPHTPYQPRITPPLYDRHHNPNHQPNRNKPRLLCINPTLASTNKTLSKNHYKTSKQTPNHLPRKNTGTNNPLYSYNAIYCFAPQLLFSKEQKNDDTQSNLYWEVFTRHQQLTVTSKNTIPRTHTSPVSRHQSPRAPRTNSAPRTKPITK